MTTNGTNSDALVLGLDAGTGSLRAAVFDLAGQQIATSTAAYETLYPQPGWAEQRPDDWWTALVVAVQACVQQIEEARERIIGLAIDAPCNLVLVAEDGQPLINSVMWMDLRAVTEAHQITDTQDPVLRYCGGDVPAEWPLPKALWLRRHIPVLWKQASYVVEEMTWLTWRLTGNWIMPLNSATVKWHYRTTTAETGNPAGWPLRLMEDVGLGDLTEKLPSVVLPLGTRAGALADEAAHTLGLRPGISVAMSGIDAYAGMIGINALTPGTVALITGTSTCQLTQSALPVFHPGLWGPFEAAVFMDQWTLEAGQASTGGTVRWLLDKLGGELPRDNEQRYMAADHLAGNISPGADGLIVLDFWQGSRTPIKDPLARGVIYGLTPAHDTGHLLRAVYEATAYGNRRILETLGNLSVPVESIRACGGGTHSKLWLQILADVAGIPLTLTEVDDAVALGSAICAAVGVGCYATLSEAAAAMVRTASSIPPDPRTQPAYAEGYQRYLALHALLAPAFANLGD
jgi:FGGY-family pentulose kinase